MSSKQYPEIKTRLQEFGTRMERANTKLYDYRFDGLFAVILGGSWGALLFGFGFEHTPDSFEYIMSASQLWYSKQLTVLPVWPPFFPVLIAFLTLFIPYPASAAAAVVGLSTVFFMLFFAVIIRQYSRNILVNILIILTLFFFPTFTQITRTVWSENPYVALALACVFFFIKYVKTEQLTFLFWSFLFASLASLTRYVGIALLLSLSILILWMWTIKRISITYRQYFVWNILAYIPLGIYLVRNYLISGGVFGVRESMQSPVSGNLLLVISAMRQDLATPMLVVMGLGLILFILVFSLAGNREFSPPLFFTLLYMGFHLFFLILSASQFIIDPINSRLLFPFYIFLFLSVLLALDGGLKHNFKNLEFNTYWHRLVPIVVVGLLVSTLYIQVEHFRKNVVVDTFERWRNSSYHYKRGYNVSSTAEEFNNLFNNILGAEEYLHVYIQIPSQSSGQIFLMQRSLLEASRISGVQFIHQTGNDYSMIIQRPNNNQHHISYHYTPFYTDATLFEDVINDELSTSEFSNFVIIYDKESVSLEMPIMIKDYFSAEYNVSRSTISPYAVDYFVLK